MEQKQEMVQAHARYRAMAETERQMVRACQARLTQIAAEIGFSTGNARAVAGVRKLSRMVDDLQAVLESNYHEVRSNEEAF
jgi:hypothetical protein